MANTNTPTPNAASAVIDEAVRITTVGSRRTSDAAQAASRKYLDFANQINRDLFSLWTTASETSLKTTFEAQNAALANSRALLDTSTRLSQDVLSRWADLARQAQATTLKTYQSSTRLLGGLTNE